MTKRQQQQNLSDSRNGGYTIIESLVAMIVVSVLMIAIAPVMAFSVATRVQARRVELATQAATTYINALRAGAIKSTEPQFPVEDDTNPPAAPTSLNNLYCVKFDERPDCNGSKDFRVQGVRPTGPTPTDTGYALTVRVYRADAVGGMKIEQQSVANSGLGDPKAPLVVMKTEIPPTTQGGSSAYRSLCDRLKDTNTKRCQ